MYQHRCRHADAQTKTRTRTVAGPYTFPHVRFVFQFFHMSWSYDFFIYSSVVVRRRSLLSMSFVGGCRCRRCFSVLFVVILDVVTGVVFVCSICYKPREDKEKRENLNNDAFLVLKTKTLGDGMEKKEPSSWVRKLPFCLSTWAIRASCAWLCTQNKPFEQSSGNTCGAGFHPEVSSQEACWAALEHQRFELMWTPGGSAQLF